MRERVALGGDEGAVFDVVPGRERRWAAIGAMLDVVCGSQRRWAGTGHMQCAPTAHKEGSTCRCQRRKNSRAPFGTRLFLRSVWWLNYDGACWSTTTSLSKTTGMRPVQGP